MKKRNLSFSRMVWIFSLFLTLFPSAVNARVSAAKERNKAVIGARKDKCLRDDSQTISHEIHVQHELAAGILANADTVGTFQSVTGGNSADIHFQLADSLIYLQASLNGSEPLWMMLDTGSSVTVFDESVLRALGIRFLGEGIAHGPGQGSAQK